MKDVRFLVVQVVALGSLAFTVWALLVNRGDWTRLLSLDALAGLVLGVALTALFVLLVALPAQSLLPGRASLSTRLLTGCLSGPLGVWLGLLVFTKYPLKPDSYIERAWSLHMIYAGVGLAFAWAWHQRKSRSNQP